MDEKTPLHKSQRIVKLEDGKEWKVTFNPLTKRQAVSAEAMYTTVMFAIMKGFEFSIETLNGSFWPLAAIVLNEMVLEDVSSGATFPIENIEDAEQVGGVADIMKLITAGLEASEVVESSDDGKKKDIGFILKKMGIAG